MIEDATCTNAPAPARQAWPPMFGHQVVPFGRHIAGVFGSLFVTGTAAAVLVVLLVLGTKLSAPEQPSANWSSGTLFIIAGAVWLMILFSFLPSTALIFTIARLMLTSVRQNFGWAYTILGLLSAWATTIGIAGLPKSTFVVTPGALLGFGACGLLIGASYWFIAARAPRSQASAEPQRVGTGLSPE